MGKQNLPEKQEMNEIQELNINPWSKLPIVKKCFAPTLTDDEFKIFIGLGMSLGANPFTREIWAVKYGTQAAAIFLGRDFYRRKAQEQSDYNGHIVNAVYESDGFSIKNGQPEHVVNSFKDRGNLIGAFCAVYKKGQTVPFFVTVRLDEYLKKKSDGEAMSNWKTMPETMIKKVAEAQALRGAYQGIFRGTYDESELYDTQAIDMDKEELKQKRAELTELLASCQDEELIKEVADDLNSNETIENITKWITKLSVK